jgi:hypothetical protein
VTSRPKGGKNDCKRGDYLWGVLGRGQAGVEKVKEEVDVRR